MADREPKEVFEFDSFLKENGYKLVGMSDSGSPIVQNAAGEEGIYDLKGLLESEGRQFGDVDVQYNTSSDPVQQSPVDLITRAKLSFGNTQGNLKYLQKQFDEVKLDENNGLVVKKDNVWHAVDPNLLGKGSAWDKTQAIMKSFGGFRGNSDLAGDLAELGPEAINAVTTGVGATLGSVMGPLGTVEGAGAGGVASGAIRTSLGRLMGTYEATDAEQLGDIGLEALFSAGGQGIAAGAKPAMSGLVSAAKNVGKWASNGVKEAFAKSIGALTKAGAGPTRVLIDDSAKVGASITKYASKAANVDDAINTVAKDKAMVMEEFLEKATDTLPEKYGSMLDDLVQTAEAKNFKVDMKSVVDDSFKSVSELGIGTIDNKGNFRFLSPKEFGTRASQGANAELLSAEEQQAIKPLVNAMYQFSKVGNLSGKQAAIALKGFEKNLNKLSRYAYGKGNPQLEAMVSKVTEGFRNSVATQFDNAGLSQQYTGLAKLYKDYGDAVKFARKTLNSEKGIETLSNQLVTPAGKQTTSKGLVGTLAELTGSEGQAMLDKFSILHATEKFLPSTPQLGFFQVLGTASAVGAGAPALPTALAVSAASTPRLMARATQGVQAVNPTQVIPYAQHGLDFLKQRTPEELKTLLSNDELFQNFIRPIATAALQEETDKETLLRGTGAKK